MTLVVATLAANQVLLASHLRVIEDPKGGGYLHGVLKFVTLLGDLGVGFAGYVDPALDALAAAKNCASEGFEAVCNELVPFARTGPNQPEFLVISSRPARIAKVNDGVTHDRLLNARIGDRTAFEHYQRLRGGYASITMPAGLPADLSAMAEMSGAFVQLVREGLSETVGESAITARSSADGYLTYQPLANATMPAQRIPSGVETALRFGTAAEGGHAYTVLVPMAPGPGAVGVHFLQGQLGLLYHPLVDRYPIRYSPVSHEEFRQNVLRDYGMDINGVIVR